MIHFVYGGSGSGKSKFAEDCAVSSGCSKKYYIATMQVYGEEGLRRVERHRKLREGKGFVTLERKFLDSKGEGEKDLLADKGDGDEVFLLECISNLVANEMFKDNEVVEENIVTEKICAQILLLMKNKTNVVIVSNNIFEASENYDETTLAYMRTLAKVNNFIATQSDRVTEVVCGIPQELKK